MAFIVNTGCRYKAAVESVCALPAAVAQLCRPISTEVKRVQQLYGLVTLFVVAVSVTSCAYRSTTRLPLDGRSDVSEAPARIQRLAREIVSMRGEEVRDVIVREFGPARRDIGSGVRIEQWDTDAGVLTFHPATGPTFVPNGGKIIWLMATRNSALANITGSFEMYTLPAEHRYRTPLWLGNLHLYADRTYRYVASGENRNRRAQATSNFFMLHPTGRFGVRFADGYNAETKLETLKDGTLLCHVGFSPDDGSPQQVLWIKSWFFKRQLTFGADKPLTFELEKWWDNYWN